MIAIGLIGLCLYAFISIILRVLDAAGRKITDYIFWVVGIILFVSVSLIMTGLAIVAWRTLP